MFSVNPRGAKASAILYSIIETAKANDLNLYEYMKACLQELAKPAPDINSLLPGTSPNYTPLGSSGGYVISMCLRKWAILNA